MSGSEPAAVPIRTVSIVGIHFYRTEDERLAQAESLMVGLEGTEHTGLLSIPRSPLTSCLPTYPVLPCVSGQQGGCSSHSSVIG